MSEHGNWWRSGVVYQIYLRSFMDSNGDGVGDLAGVLSKLDHLSDLGITILWLTPFFASPNHDNGYDVSDFLAIDPQQGTLADVDRLLTACHARDIRVVFDLCVNHTSDEHPWFVESAASRDSPKRDWYHWRTGRGDGPPNNWSGGFSPSAWERHPATGDYYLHYYSTKMPDLNWDNSEVRAEMARIMRWWLDRGVDGFRLDSLNLIKKNMAFPDAVTPDPAAPGYCYDPPLIYNQPGLLGLLQEMHRDVFTHYDMVTIGETSCTPAEVASEFVRADNHAIDMVFNFEPVEADRLDPIRFREVQRRWYGLVRDGGWTSQYLSNHDQPRQVSKFGDDGEWRVRSAKLLALMLHTLPGTPFIYQGEEIGMTNVDLPSIGDYRDIAMHNLYETRVANGELPDGVLADLRRISRDNARTPMQWNDTPQGGFTTGTPWIAVNPNNSEVNVEADRADPNGIFAFYKALIALRSENRVMWAGSFDDTELSHGHLYAYTRTIEEECWWVVLNLSSRPTSAPIAIPNGTLLLSTMEEARDTAPTRTLAAWEGFVIRADRGLVL